MMNFISLTVLFAVFCTVCFFAGRFIGWHGTNLFFSIKDRIVNYAIRKGIVKVPQAVSIDASAALGDLLVDYMKTHDVPEIKFSDLPECEDDDDTETFAEEIAAMAKAYGIE